MYLGTPYACSIRSAHPGLGRSTVTSLVLEQCQGDHPAPPGEPGPQRSPSNRRSTGRVDPLRRGLFRGQRVVPLRTGRPGPPAEPRSVGRGRGHRENPVQGIRQCRLTHRRLSDPRRPASGLGRASVPDASRARPGAQLRSPQESVAGRRRAAGTRFVPRHSRYRGGHRRPPSPV